MDYQYRLSASCRFGIFPGTLDTEKPDIQAIATTGAGLRPTTETGCVYYDAEYRRLGTLSLLAGIDLLTGIAIPIVSESHKSSDFILLFKRLDEMYPKDDIIRIVCDNHSAHESKETRNYLKGWISYIT